MVNLKDPKVVIFPSIFFWISVSGRHPIQNGAPVSANIATETGDWICIVTGFLAPWEVRSLQMYRKQQLSAASRICIGMRFCRPWEPWRSPCSCDWLRHSPSATTTSLVKNEGSPCLGDVLVGWLVDERGTIFFFISDFSFFFGFIVFLFLFIFFRSCLCCCVLVPGTLTFHLLDTWICDFVLFFGLLSA